MSSEPGTVTVENMGLPGVTVQLTGVSSASAVTDDNGQYAFTGLRMGNYSVEISGFDSNEVGFSSTAASVTVGVGESKIVSFDGTYLRTAGIMGRVSVEGAGLEGVTVSLSGGPDATDMTTETDAAGQYSFAKLRAGDYAVGISGYNTDDYEFEATSKNVTVALGETANVPFEGVLLRTAGISGRVSVEGMGLEGIAVTLSMADAEDKTAMTDAGGLYAFAGLAAGDYTVGIMVESAAYVFETMSMDVTVGDDETAIVNFEGAHARTASVSGMLFIDELMKNDMYDEGEDALPHAGVPVVLVGPGINDQMPSATDSTGAYSFMGLRSGNYQLVVPVTGPMGDFAYGGDPTGYALEVGVGEAVTQNLPIDITHTTVHFGVTLKAGETRGAPLPGAMVTLYADAMGETKVGEGMTMVDEETMHAVASIRVARMGTTGNMVHAGVSADSAYTVADGMTAVMWDPQKTYTMGANDNDIVNLNVDVTFGGATVTTDYGGGGALAGWAVSVAHGDTMYADTLDAEGMAAFKMTVDSAGALPATYTFSVDTIQDNMLDGGEMFEGTAVDYTHTGLALAGTMDAGMIEVNYTTQTLKVYVHHERDQVHGYTGNVLDGDERVSGKVDLSVRYIDDNGRSRSFTSKEWNAASNTITSASAPGATTFTGLPADANIIVQAEEVAPDPDAEEPETPIMLIEPDELAAYTAMEENGVMGGAFGAMGGFSHTVSLCPLMATDPTGQDHGECGSFAFVETHAVSGLVWKRGVTADPKSDGFVVGPNEHPLLGDPTFVPGISVSLDPVEGKNIAGEAESATTTEKPVRTRGENAAGTSILDETHQFDFGRMAAGVYKLTVPDGWRVRTPAADDVLDPRPKDATGMLGNAFSPLMDNILLDVTPATALVYGHVTDSEGFPMAEVAVEVNNVIATTDEHGRYIAEGVTPDSRRIRNVWYRNMIFVEIDHEGSDAIGPLDHNQVFAANSPITVDIELTGASKTASISGTVTASGSGDPVAGAEIMVDGEAPNNAATSGVNQGKLVTGADGTYTAIINAGELGDVATVTVNKTGMAFRPASLEAPSHPGSETSGFNFTGFLNATIAGRVVATDGRAMGGVMVTAAHVDDTDNTVSHTTTARGSFALSVSPFGTYTVTATAENFTFSYPNDRQTVSVAPGLTQDFGDIQAMTFGALNVRAMRLRTADDASTTDIDESERLDGQIRVSWDANDSTAVPEGYETVTYAGPGATTTTRSRQASPMPAPRPPCRYGRVGEVRLLRRRTTPPSWSWIVATATDTDGSGEAGATLESHRDQLHAMVTVGAVDPTTSGVGDTERDCRHDQRRHHRGQLGRATSNANTRTSGLRSSR